MKKIQTVFLILATIFGVGLLTAMPALASDGDRKLECSVLPQSICDSAEQGELQNSGIWRILLLIINILTVGIGVVAVGAIVFAGFLYTTAADDPAKTKKAIEIIRNTAVGLIVYALMFAGANFLIPGGIFGGTSGGSRPCTPESGVCAE